MKSILYTWGTGAAWGRDLGCLPTDKKARNHTSLSLLVGTGESQTHFLIDVGVPCVESMIDAVQDGDVPIPPPNAVFITHPHYDHHGDLTKLVLSRENGWIRNHSFWTLTEEFFTDYQSTLSEEAVLSLKDMETVNPKLLRRAVADCYTDISDDKWKRNYVRLNKSYPEPLSIIATTECVETLRGQFGFVNDKLSWQTVTEFDVWYGVVKENGKVVPWSEVCEKKPESVHPILFKSLPVWHSSSAPGACLYIFRILNTTAEGGSEEEKKVVVSGDFGSLDESVIQNHDLKNPDLLLIETNTAYTDTDTHTNWIQNKQLISKWFSKEHKARILLYHLSSSYDWMDGYVPQPMTDTDWRELCRDEDFADYQLNIDIAEDGNRYEI